MPTWVKDVTELGGVVVTLVTALKAWEVVQTVLNVLMEANPVGIAIVAIAALVAGVILLYNHCEEFRNFLTVFLEVNKTMFTWIFNALAKLISNVVETAQKVWKAFSDAFDTVKKVAGDVISWVVDKFNSIRSKVSEIAENVSSFFSNAFDTVRTVASSVVGWVVDKFNDIRTRVYSVVDSVVNAFNGIKDRLGNFFGGIVNGVLDTFKEGLNFIIDCINGAIKVINKGAKIFGVEIPLIPRMAQGGIVERPTLAIVGESGREAVVPLEKNTEWIDELANKINAKNQSGGGNTFNIQATDPFETASVIARKQKQSQILGMLGG